VANVKKGQSVPAPCVSSASARSGKSSGVKISAQSRRKTFAISPQKSWNIKPSERLAIALQSRQPWWLRHLAIKVTAPIPAAVTDPHDGVMVEVAS
jgi:hypothetical protein